MVDVRDTPEVSILLLGDAEVGKSSFLSRLSLGIQPTASSSASASTTSVAPPPYSLPALRDLDQPFTFSISLYARPYTFSFHDTASPINYTLLTPNFIILCFDISRRSTLARLHTHWKTVVEGHFNKQENIPIMVLGLKRDLRKAWTKEQGERVPMVDNRGRSEGRAIGPEDQEYDGDERSVMPQEALRVAQEMRCDRYAECSAVTGELCREVLEDIARTAAKTTTEKGGRTEGGCTVM